MTTSDLRLKVQIVHQSAFNSIWVLHQHITLIATDEDGQTVTINPAPLRTYTPLMDQGFPNMIVNGVIFLVCSDPHTREFMAADDWLIGQLAYERKRDTELYQGVLNALGY